MNSHHLLFVLVDEPAWPDRCDDDGAGAATPAKELVSLADTTISTGLIERSAAAFASGMQEGAGDDGFFGPASVTWRMSADLASPVAGLRSLLMQEIGRAHV